MTVVLLDASRPDLIPAGAVSLLAQTVAVTEEVHPSLLWQLPSYVLVSPDGDDMTKTLVTSDRDHPAVVERLKWGQDLVEGGHVRGGRLLEAVSLMDRLRRQGPWEKTQTHDSLRRYLLEEVYELLDAIDHGTPEELKSELGDLLLQVLFHARIAADAAHGGFDIDDVAQSFIDKITQRTVGILGGEHADLERQIDEWEAAKAAERARWSVFSGIVTAQPALALVQKVFERLAGANFPVAAVSPSLYRVDIPFRKHAAVSVEDELRRRVIALMDQVRAAEDAADADGVMLRNENTWRKYLGMDYVDDGPHDAAEADATEADADDEADYVGADDPDLREAVGETAEVPDAAPDDDPADPPEKRKNKKRKGLTVPDVPGMVVREKWSAEGE